MKPNKSQNKGYYVLLITILSAEYLQFRIKHAIMSDFAKRSFVH